MAQIVKVGLIGATVLAVLLFGGTEPLSFSIVQFVFLTLAVLLLATDYRGLVGTRGLPVAVPFLLVLLVLLQITPIPGLLVQLIRSPSGPTSGLSFATISIAPHATLTHLLFLLTYLAAFYLTIAVCRRPNGSRHLIFALLGLGAFEAFYGMVQYLTGWQQIFTFVKKYNLESATGTYINGNHFAGLLEMVLPFALALVFYHSAKLRHAHPQSPARLGNLLRHQEFQKLIFWLFLAIILFVSLIYSKSRMGIMSALLSSVFIFVLLATSGRQRAGLVMGGAFLAAGIWMAVWIGPGPVIARFENLGAEFREPGQGRWAIWQDTFRLIGDHPWLGSGLGTFPVDYTSEQTAFLELFVNHAHNDFLEIASELGFAGGTLLFGSILYLLGHAIRGFFAEARSDFARFSTLGCAASLVAILLHSLTDFNLYIPANAIVLGVVLGLAWSVREAYRSGLPKVAASDS